MTITILSGREFNQDPSRAKKASKRSPVFIIDRGKPVHVLLSIDDYRRLAGQEMTLAEALAQRDVPDFEFNPTSASGFVRRPNPRPQHDRAAHGPCPLNPSRYAA